MRATYVDETDSYVVTVGVAVLPTSAEAQKAAQDITGATQPDTLGATVHAVPFKGTPAGQFTDKQRQFSSTLSRGTYVVLYTVGYTDSRPSQKISLDPYASDEMTHEGLGVADRVLSALAAPVPPPHCPSTEIPGC